MSRDLQRPYAPFPVPNDPKELPRYIAAELDRIRQALIAQPVALSVEESDSITVTTTVNWSDLFIGSTPTWDVPGGNFEPSTGIWTNPQYGLYHAVLSLEVKPFGSGNKEYYASIAIDYESPTGPERIESSDGGSDIVPLGVTLTGQMPIIFGSPVKCQVTIVHEQFVGIAAYTARLQLLRVSD